MFRTTAANVVRPLARCNSSLASVVPRDVARSRLQEHYTNTLSHDLLYLLYAHPPAVSPPDPLTRAPAWSPLNPYAQNRPPPRAKGGRYLQPNPSSAVPELESITVSTMSKAALQQKSSLVALMMAYQAITGQPPQSRHPGPYGAGTDQGIVVTRSTRKSASFKIRPGAPTGVKIELKGEPMYAFLDTLTTFVLPRLKSFNGIPLPPASHPKQSPSSMSGVISFGLPNEAMGLFPQIETALDQYPRAFGMNIYLKTNLKGRGAQEKSRALLSGLGVPFVKR
ncbi:hypothetical protein MNV49_006640 [Pseudohyphozyma bogoriensis]|nr:hypothetical protein MNV49_006640 [Pseudohyphozyma bogoriensis]